MKRSARDEQKKLYESTIRLKELSFSKNLDYDLSMKIRQEQEELYKKWEFYNKLIKIEDKIKCKNNDK
nr:MAG TPA: hypothetical protein [Bacteriophage sp.]